MASNFPNNDQYGVWNDFAPSSLTNSDNYGMYNVFSGDGISSKIGSYTRIDSNGNGQHVGAYQLINGSSGGTGNKFGTFTQINSGAGGTHYGIYSNVLKPGTNNFAGYFLGNVGIGTTTANTYTFPASRGANGQIMQTDGSGNLTWQTVASGNSWSLTGNAGTTPSSVSFGTSIPVNENFIGTTDNKDLVFGTSNLEKMRIKGFNIGIGETNPTARIDMFDQGSFPSFRIRKVTASGNSTSVDILTEGPPFLGGTRTAASFRAVDGLNNYAIIVPASSGDVGFGTATPSTKLHIVNPTAGAVRIQDGTQLAGRVLTSDANGLATWQNPLNLGYGWLLKGNSGITTPANPLVYGSSLFAASEDFIGTKDFNAVVFGANNSERMRITAVGDVGIGISNPSTKLHLVKSLPGAIMIQDGTQGVGKVLTSNAAGQGTWQTPSSNSAWSLTGNTAISNPVNPGTYGTSIIGATENFIGTTDNRDIVFGSNNLERMRVKNTSGFFGVGTANPSTAFEVASFGTNEFRLSSRGAFGASRFSMVSDKELPDEWRPAYIESGDNGSFTGRMDFFTNGTGIANKFGSVRAMSVVNANVGIGISTPTEKLHVFTNSDSNKTSILGFAQQSTTGADYSNIGVRGVGRGLSGWGLGAGVMGVGETANSYFATGVYAHLGILTPSLPFTSQALYANGNSLGYSGIFVGGNVGIGAAAPTNLLHLNAATAGALRIVDGTQAAGKVLTSNATGVGTWQNPIPSGFSHYLGELFLGGIIYELYKGADGLEHGLIVSLTESGLIAWQTTSTVVGANRTEDGTFNTSVMLSGPISTYLATLGAGWYLPGIDELQILYNQRYYANKALRLGGYTLLSRDGTYWSSTENGGASAYALSFNLNSNFLDSKSDPNSVRAIRSF